MRRIEPVSRRPVCVLTAGRVGIWRARKLCRKVAIRKAAVSPDGIRIWVEAVRVKGVAVVSTVISLGLGMMETWAKVRPASRNIEISKLRMFTLSQKESGLNELMRSLVLQRFFLFAAEPW